MIEELITAVSIDDEGRLRVKPKSAKFPYIYREAMEVTWDSSQAELCSPVPRSWSYADWFCQICDAVLQQGTRLKVDSATQWRGVSSEVRQEMLARFNSGAA